MLLILSGPSGIGKSFVINELVNKHEFVFITPYTSRSPRVSEANGIDYHFRSLDDIHKLSNNCRNGYWAYPLDHNIYGYDKEIINHNNKKIVIHAFSKIAISIKKDDPKVLLIFLNYSHRDTMLDRIRARVNSKDEYDQRVYYSDQEISQVKYYDHYFVSDNPNDFVKMILNIVK